jgi:Na+-transporting NADH:ubiquinone oxidoreductase subunit NqrD
LPISSFLGITLGLALVAESMEAFNRKRNPWIRVVDGAATGTGSINRVLVQPALPIP